MKIYEKNMIFFLLSGFQTWFYQMRWYFPYRSFKRSKWWRHKFDHT